MPDKPFRQAVVAVFVNAQGEVLVGRRFGTTDAWQFPQGGIDPGETQQEALKREVREEIGCRGFSILKVAPKTLRYDFPPTLEGKVAQRYRGQEMHWFLCQFIDGQGADLEQASDQEFDALAWVSPQQAYHGIIPWKKDVYRQGLKALGLPVDDERPAAKKKQASSLASR